MKTATSLCFPCRKAYKDRQRGSWPLRVKACPQCGGATHNTLMTNLPPRSKVKEWAKLEHKFLRGTRFAHNASGMTTLKETVKHSSRVLKRRNDHRLTREHDWFLDS